MKSMYHESDLVRIAKRENNKKRGYLVVNRLQGKHIPVVPDQALSMFGALADLLQEAYGTQKLLVVGFAETATAIGAAAAARLGAYYIQTTREPMDGAGCLYFSEEHSHATEQKLVKDGLDQVISGVDRIVFVEDEVTTGKTILNMIRVLEQEYPGQVSYAAASILNGMDEEALHVYKAKGIDLHYLVKTDHAAYEQCAMRYTQKGRYVRCIEGTNAVQDHMQYTEWKKVLKADERQAKSGAAVRLGEKEPVDVREYKISGWMDARRLVSGTAYEQACMQLWQDIDSLLHTAFKGRVLVLGTEEFMYPALLAAARLAQYAVEVRFHATTRSPIEVFMERDYPLHARYELCSLYDRNRKTFVYDLGSYDAVLIITDAHNEEREGVDSLIQAAAQENQNIYIIRWC